MAWKIERTQNHTLVYSRSPVDKQVLFGIASDHNAGEMRRYGFRTQESEAREQGIHPDRWEWGWQFPNEDLPALQRDLCMYYIDQAKRFEASAAETRSAKALLAKLCRKGDGR